MFTEEQDDYFNSVFKSKMDDCALDFVWEEQQKAPQDCSTDPTEVNKSSSLGEARGGVLMAGFL